MMPALPGPDLTHNPSTIALGNRQVHVLQHQHDPQLVVFGNVLSPAECDALIALAQPRMQRSRTVHSRTGGDEVNQDRTSLGMFFQRAEFPLVHELERRMAQLLRWPESHGEGLQVLHYPPGAEYKPHYDYFDPAEPGTEQMLRRGGQRVATMIVYLSEPAVGGATVFPDLGVEVAPRRGHAVFFSYDPPNPTSRTLHGGTPVLQGDKWIATQWLRERAFV